MNDTEKSNTAVSGTAGKSYLYGLGRRKRSVAQVRLYLNGSGKVTVNDKDLKEYLPVFENQMRATAPLKETGMLESVDVVVKTQGGGITGQADAIRLGLARALLVHNEALRPVLKKLGLLVRDARKKERKKPGLKKARRAPQWSKR